MIAGAGTCQSSVPLLLLLLLLLLELDLRQSFCAERLGANYRRRWQLFGFRSIHGQHGDDHAEFAFGVTFVNSARWRDVRVIPSQGDADVALASQQIVGGIERNPP